MICMFNIMDEIVSENFGSNEVGISLESYKFIEMNLFDKFQSLYKVYHSTSRQKFDQKAWVYPLAPARVGLS